MDRRNESLKGGQRGEKEQEYVAIRGLQEKAGERKWKKKKIKKILKKKVALKTEGINNLKKKEK